MAPAALTFLVLIVASTCIAFHPVYDPRLSFVDEMFTVDLGGKWNLTNENGSIVTVGTVPGNVHTDLLAAGLISDPYYRFNDGVYRWIALDNWTYSTVFDLSYSVLQNKGLDTVADVVLNGHLLGNTNNMFKRYTYDITNLVYPANNTLEIRFTSAAAYATQKMNEYPYDCPASDSPVQHGELYIRPFIRKEQCSFSWDWGPCFMPQGIWKPIVLKQREGIVAYDDAVLSYVAPQIIPTTTPNTFSVYVNATFDVAQDFIATVTVSLPELSVSSPVSVGQNSFWIEVPLVQNVKLWWPRGYGDQPLYNLTTSLYNSANQLLDTVTQQIGFRSIELVTDPVPGQVGNYMYFQVNGVPIFAKGANWIPADSFENRVTYDVLQNLLQSAADANMNIVRVWGGGIYQHDAFYQIADQLGLMVWEEFMFACAMYPRDDAFLSIVSDEVVHQVQRLMYHPSIILWSGNNENEAALTWFPQTLQNRDLYVDYAKLYFDTVRAPLVQLDTSRPFWPSSPSNGPLVENPYVLLWGNVANNSFGDVHYYNYLTPCDLIEALPTPRFASEYGFQSLPSLETWRPVSLPEDWNWNSTLMNWRQHHEEGNEQMGIQAGFHFPLNFQPTQNETDNFRIWIYLTQAMQAFCVKTQSEHYRRLRGTEAKTMGAIYWQLNAIWQAPDWASIEYGGRWKMLHYFAAKFFAPVLISSYEYPNNSYNVFLVNDLTTAVSGTLDIQVRSIATGAVVNTISTPVSAPSLSSALVYTNSNITKMIESCGNRQQCFLYLNLTNSTGGVLSENYLFLSSLASVTLPPADITLQPSSITSSSATVLVNSKAIAPYTWLSTAVQGRWSDNGFLLLPDSPRTLTFYAWEPFNPSDFTSTLYVLSMQDAV